MGVSFLESNDSGGKFGRSPVEFAKLATCTGKAAVYTT
jgi:hypothetical protein